MVEAVRLGVNEFLLKPVSSTALLARLVSILAKPRQMVKKGDYYGPEPRKMSSYKPESIGPIVVPLTALTERSPRRHTDRASRASARWQPLLPTRKTLMV